MPTHIYFPLRSNAAWFGSQEARSRLERQFKINLMLYDRLILEDGRWHMSAADDGRQGMEINLGPKHISDEQRRKIWYFKAGEVFGVQANDKTVLRASAGVSYEVDFYPILYDAGLLETACYDWVNGSASLTSEGKQEVERLTDRLIQDFAADLPTNQYARKAFVRNVITDSLTSQLVGLPVSIDFRRHRSSPSSRHRWS
jgi:hypothetical protein